MRVDAKYRAELATSKSKDETREALQQLHVRREEVAVWLEGTNARIAVRVPVDLDDGDRPGMITAETLTRARKEKDEDGQVRIALEDEARLPNGIVFPRPAEQLTFPDTNNVFPAASRECRMRLALDAKLLWDLARAMGARGVVLEIESELDMIAVRPTRAGNDARGVLMPMRLDGVE